MGVFEHSGVEGGVRGLVMQKAGSVLSVADLVDIAEAPKDTFYCQKNRLR